MLPIIYIYSTLPSGFTTNGVGFVKNCISCVCTEERNGEYELKLEIHNYDRLIDYVIPGNFIKIKPNANGNPQIFEIYNVQANEKYRMASAQHVKYFLNNNLIEAPWSVPSNSNGLTPLETWNNVVSLLEYENYFNFSSNITTIGKVTAAKNRPVKLGDFIQGTRGSMLDIFGGELYFDNFNVQLNSRRGIDRDIVLKYGSAISTVEQEADNQTVYSHLLPYASFFTIEYETGKYIGETLVYADIISLNNPVQLTYQKCLAYDFSEDVSDYNQPLVKYATVGGFENWDECVEKLATVAQRYISSNNDALTFTSNNIKIDVEPALKILQNCNLCDTVKIDYKPLNIQVRAKIVKTQYDCINERYTSLELGQIKNDFSVKMSSIFKNIGGA